MAQLTGNQIVERGIVIGYSPEAIQQQGVDVRVANIKEILGTGMIPAEGKTTIPRTEDAGMNGNAWVLPPGYYEVELMEGIKMPANAALVFKTRSSLVRCGAIVESGQFDAGFETDKAGCFLDVKRAIIIEKGARIAQAIVNETAEVTNTYNGQFQGDKQRKS